MKLSSRKQLLEDADAELKRMRKLAGIDEVSYDRLSGNRPHFSATSLLQMTKIPSVRWADNFQYVGKILKSKPPKSNLSNPYYKYSMDYLEEFIEDIVDELDGNKSAIEKYFKSLSYKNGYIVSNYRGTEEKEFKLAPEDREGNRQTK